MWCVCADQFVPGQDPAPGAQAAAWEGAHRRSSNTATAPATTCTSTVRGLSLLSTYLIPLIPHCKFAVAFTVH